jgi:hypothetical protein
MLIGLHGPARSGKDTIYNILRGMSAEGSNKLSRVLVRRDAFADRLKISAMAALGYEGTRTELIALANLIKEQGEIQSFYQTNEAVNGGKGKTISGRSYLQLYGTEAHRDVFTQDFWVKAVLPDGYPDPQERDNVLLVVTDVRFDNEAARVRECGGVMVKIVRDHEKITESAHASEQELPGELIDYVLDNTGTLEDLKLGVETLINDWII